MSNDNEPIQVNSENFDPLPLHYSFHIPKPSEWRCEIAFDVTYRPMEGHHPNWFYRQMCRLLLGVRWVKDEDDED